jgi:hypothetical protein
MIRCRAMMLLLAMSTFSSTALVMNTKSAVQITGSEGRARSASSFQRRSNRFTSSRRMIQEVLKPTGIVGLRASEKRANGSRLQLKMFEHSKGGSKSAERVAVKPAAAAGELDGEGNGAHFFCACKVPGVSCNPAWPQCTPSLCASRFSMRVRSSVSRRAVGGGLC